MDTANIPKVSLGARLLDVCESGVAGAEVALSHGGVEDGDVYVRAITIHYHVVSVVKMPE